MVSSAQTDSLYEDGKIYLAIKDSNSTEIGFFNGSTITNMPTQIENVLSQFGITKIIKPFGRIPLFHCSKTYLFEFTKIDSTNALVSYLSSLGFVKYAERVPKVKIFNTPNDPMFNNGILNGQNWHLKKIGAESAWNLSTGINSSSSTPIIVAVIDNEIQITHPDLVGKIWTNPNEIPGNGVDEDGLPPNYSGAGPIADDVNGWDFGNDDNNTNPLNNMLDHGTHVSGIVAANTNNNIGISSIGFNTQIMPLKIGDDITGQISNSAGINAIYYAIWKNADVINCSWGGGGSTALATAVADAVANNITFVAAAGNDNSTMLFYPASYPDVISVAATDNNDFKASFSNYNPSIAVCAPGVNIYSAINTFQNAIGYDYKSGTSMASPIVAGLCALMKAQNPTISNTDLRNCLTITATNIDAINSTIQVGNLGSGRINAQLALLCAMGNANVWFNSNTLSNCINNNFQLDGFTNIPISNIANWNWSFSTNPATFIGQGTQNPIVTFANSGSIDVTLTVTTISPVQTYSIFLEDFLTVTPPPSSIISTYANGAICNNSAQQLLINFTNCIAPINFTLVNQLGQSVPFNTDLSNFNYYYNANINHPDFQVFNIVDANGCTSNNAVITLNTNVINCCENIIPNGDFELGNQFVNSDNTIFCSASPTIMNEGKATVQDISTNTPNQSGYSMCSSNLNFASVNLPPNPFSMDLKNSIFTVNGRILASQAYSGFTVTSPLPVGTNQINNSNFSSRLWYSNQFNVIPGNYNLDFFISSQYVPPYSLNALDYRNEFIEIRIIDATNGSNILFNSGIINLTDQMLSLGTFDWRQNSFDWSNIGFTGNIIVEINQRINFNGAPFDFNLDDITLRKTDNIPTLTLNTLPICTIPSTITATSSIASPTFSLDNVAVTNPIPVTTAGIHTISLINSGGCVVKNIFNVQPIGAIGTTIQSTNCVDYTINVNASNSIFYNINNGSLQLNNDFQVIGNSTYTVSASNSVGCTVSSIISTPQDLQYNILKGCANASIPGEVILTSTGLSSITVNNGGIVLGNTIKFPTSGTYTITASNGICNITKTIFIGNCTSCNSAPSNAIWYNNPIASIDFPSGNMPATPIVIVGNFNINTYENLSNNSDVYMASNGGLITVSPNNNFIVNNSSIQGCGNRWNGILANGSYLTSVSITGSTISDMVNGVQIINQAGLTACQSSFVNSANQSILIQDKDNSNYLNTVINQNTFNSNSSFSPYNGLYKGITGVKLLNCNNINIGDYTDPFSGNNFVTLHNGVSIIGDANIFNILGSNTNLNGVYNNQFTDIEANSNSIISYCIGLSPVEFDYSGAAVNINYDIPQQFNAYAEVKNTNTLSGTNPGMLNCGKGVVSVNCNLDVAEIPMDNMIIGVMATSLYQKGYSINHNSIHNTSIGVQLLGNFDHYTIDQQDIILTKSLNPQCKQTAGTMNLIGPIGVDIRDFGVSNYNLPFVVSNNSIKIDPIVGTGIASLGGSDNHQIIGNTIAYHTTSAAPATNYLNDKSLNGITVTNAEGSTISDNEINGIDGSLLPVVQNARNSKGIFMERTGYNILSCNRIQWAKQGMYAWGDNYTPDANITYNKFKYNQTPLYTYDGSASSLGSFGDIGNASTENANDFDFGTVSGAWTLYKVYRNSSFPLSNTITTNTSFLASLENGAFVPAAKYGLNPNTSSYFDPCVPSWIVAPSTGGGSGSGVEDHSLDIANEEIDYINYPIVGQWLDEKTLYDRLDRNPTLRNSNQDLLDFYTLKRSTLVGKIRSADSALAAMSSQINNSNSGDLFNFASNSNNDIENGELWEQNEHDINNLALQVMQNGYASLSSEDKTFIATLATTCPYIGGSAVFKARSMHAVFVPNIQYNDRVLCIPQTLNKNAANSNNPNLDIDSLNEANMLSQSRITNFLDHVIKSNDQIEKTNTISIGIYPNPASNQITINYNCSTDGVCRIFNSLGEEVMTISLTKTNSTVTTNIENIANGLYTYQISFLDCLNTNGKITVIK